MLLFSARGHTAALSSAKNSRKGGERETERENNWLVSHRRHSQAGGSEGGQQQFSGLTEDLVNAQRSELSPAQQARDAGRMQESHTHTHT